MKPTRTTLTPDEIPKKWYNILPDLPVPLPPPLNAAMLGVYKVEAALAGTKADASAIPRAWGG